MTNARGESRRRAKRILAVGLFAVLSSCSHDSTGTGVKPTLGVACRPSSGTGTITVASLQTTIVDFSQGGTVFELAGNGASYLLVPEFATGNVSITPTPYTLGSPNASGSVASATEPSSRVDGPATIAGLITASAMPAARQRRFDERLRIADRRALAKRFGSRMPNVIARCIPTRTSASRGAAASGSWRAGYAT